MSVAVVGAGLAGLACARQLAQAGIPFVVLEASEEVGGRVCTDRVDGFLLDRGFQALLTAYPEAERLLDYELLELGELYPGALVRVGGRFHRVADPFRRPRDAVSAFFSPVASLRDYPRLARLRGRARTGTVESLFARRETTAVDLLRRLELSSDLIERFFRPFLGAVFLERQLATSSRMVDFAIRMFSLGATALPAGRDGCDSAPARRGSSRGLGAHRGVREDGREDGRRPFLGREDRGGRGRRRDRRVGGSAARCRASPSRRGAA